MIAERRSLTVADTHAAIWLTQQQVLLSKAAKDALVHARTVGGLAIADVTLREVALLVASRRLTISTSLETYLHFLEAQFTVLPVNAQIAARSIRFGASFPRDPADQLIGATAVVYGAKLVTKDERIRDSKEVDCVW